MEKNSVLKLEQAAPSSVLSFAGGIPSPLLRRFLHRDLSPLLIVILLFLAPLTFSNENIPNFQPDCAANFPVSEKRRCSIAIARAVSSPVMASSPAGVASPQVHYLLTHNTPLHSVKTSRAPPHSFFL
jgi:hypothetical protein